MKVARLKKKQEKKEFAIDESYSMKNLIKILLVLLVVFSVFYFITTLLVKNINNSKDDSSAVVVDYSKIIMSQLLNRPQKEYYVIATKSSIYETSYMKIDYISVYNEYINDYKQEENSLEFYYIDLDSALNKKYLGEKLNITNDIENLTINDEVLFKIKNGKIEEKYIGKDEILEALSSI